MSNSLEEKIKKKKFDLLIGNAISIEGAGVEVDINIVPIINDKDKIKEYR